MDDHFLRVSKKNMTKQHYHAACDGVLGFYRAMVISMIVLFSHIFILLRSMSWHQAALALSAKDFIPR